MPVVQHRLQVCGLGVCKRFLLGQFGMRQRFLLGQFGVRQRLLPSQLALQFQNSSVLLLYPTVALFTRLAFTSLAFTHVTDYGLQIKNFRTMLEPPTQ